MRELKFRVLDKIKKRMITHEQDFIPLKVTNWGVLRLSPNYEENLYEFVEPADNSEWNIMQFTGLKDKNSKEIYEGDIDKETGFFIKWNQFHCCFSLFSELGMQREIMADWIDEKGNPPKTWQNSDIEIIGNIYENPELLK